MLEVKNLCKEFKEKKGIKKAVDNISFKLEKGEIVGLLGENGAGKTTTMRMISTMLKPSSGSINVNGFDAVKNSADVRRNIGILFGGDVGIYDRLTARENIRYFAELNDVKKEEINKRIDEMAKELQKIGIPYTIFKKKGLSNTEINERLKEDKVKVMTIHMSKGLEANNVIVIGSAFFNVEEKCIGYVAATRARDLLVWTRAQRKKKMDYEVWE